MLLFTQAWISEGTRSALKERDFGRASLNPLFQSEERNDEKDSKIYFQLRFDSTENLSGYFVLISLIVGRDRKSVV